METISEQMIRIANEHGMEAKRGVNGGVDVYIACYNQERDDWKWEVETCHNLRQLKLALGYQHIGAGREPDSAPHKRDKYNNTAPVAVTSYAVTLYDDGACPRARKSLQHNDLQLFHFFSAFCDCNFEK